MVRPVPAASAGRRIDQKGERTLIVNQLKTLDSKEGIMERISPGFPLSVYQTDFAEAEAGPGRRAKQSPELGRCTAGPGGVRTASPSSLVPWHWHEDFQLCLVNRGTVRFHVVRQSCRLTQGTGLFINRRLAHMAEPESPDASYYGINVHPCLICSQTESLVYQQMLLPLLQLSTSSLILFDKSTPEGQRLTEGFSRILSLSEQTDTAGRELLIQSELLSAWPGLLRLGSGSGEIVSAAGNRRLKEILLYISAHYPEKISLASLAAHSHLSPGECSRFFHRATGLNLFSYLLQYRIRQSRRLLSETELSIAQIALECGFSSQSYYTACFRRQEGCTPNQYRRRAQRG